MMTHGTVRDDISKATSSMRKQREFSPEMKVKI